MTYQLKGGEEIRDGKLYGWTGATCGRCRGTGFMLLDGIGNETRCLDCAGTGEYWGLMPDAKQPHNLRGS